MAKRISGGEALIAQTLRNGVDTIFGLPGAQTYPMFDAMARRGNSVRAISARHEQGVAYMAMGYAKASGRPGVFSVVPGPGVLNTTAALCTAMGSSTPVLCLTGQVPSAYLGRGRGHLHELSDQRATLRSIIKWADRAERVQDAAPLVNEAFRQMRGGRPGPAAIEMCWDTMAQSAPVDLPDAAEPPPPPPVDPDEIDRAAALIRAAKRPMIFLGSGAQHAQGAVRALAKAIGAPVTSFRGGRGVVPETDALGLSSAAAYELWPSTDLAIGIGTRMEMPYMRWGGMGQYVDRDERRKLIRIDIDATEMLRLKPHVGVVADAAEGAAALAKAVDRKGPRPTLDPDRLDKARARSARKIAKIQPQVAYLEVIRDVLPADGFFVEELCQVGFASFYAFPVLTPRTYVTAGFQGTLGFGFPTALGVKVAAPDKAVVSVCGDGGFMFAVQELATAAQFDIAVTTLVFNNGAYGNVKRDQQTNFDGRVLGSDLANPDFMRLAESFGVGAERVDSPATLRPALERALASDQPRLIEVTVPFGSEASPWPLIMPAPK
ncbi:MAG: thiamine pyrophosphate-binding protein [Alphaproteobacteria bacterium]